MCQYQGSMVQPSADPIMKRGPRHNRRQTPLPAEPLQTGSLSRLSAGIVHRLEDWCCLADSNRGPADYEEDQ